MCFVSRAYSDCYVLIYHRFDDARYPTTSTSLEELEKQITFLKSKGYRFVSLKEFLAFLDKGSFPKRCVLVTVDDGYKSTYKAYRVFKRERIPFVLFLYMEAVDRYPDFLSVKQINEMLSSGLVSLGLHSYSHMALSKLGIMGNSLKASLEADISRAYSRFVKLFGFSPAVYSYPYGEYSREAVEVVDKMGFKAAFTQDIGAVSSCTSRYLVPRIPVVGSFAELGKFEKTLSYRDLCVDFLPFGFVPQNLAFEASIPRSFSRCYFYTSSSGWMPVKVFEGKVEVFVELNFVKGRIGLRCIRNKTIYQRLRLVMSRP